MLLAGAARIRKKNAHVEIYFRSNLGLSKSLREYQLCAGWRPHGPGDHVQRVSGGRDHAGPHLLPGL